MTDLDALALTTYGEARGESLKGKVAVLAVIQNRVALGTWGGTAESVCFAPFQFSCWIPQGGTANANTLKALAAMVKQGRTLPTGDVALNQCYDLAHGVLERWIGDCTHGASHYFVTQSQWPTWALGHVPVAIIGAHSFFRLP